MKNFLESLGITVIRESSNELTCICPWCEGKKLYVNKVTGKHKCQAGSCQHTGNAYTVVRDLMNETNPAKIKEILGQYNLTSADDRPAQAKPEPAKPHIRLTKDDCDYMTPEELDSFCKVYEIEKKALQTVMGLDVWRHTKEPWALFPSYNPNCPDMAWGILRAHFERKLIKTSHGNDKYPQIYGSKHGLFGFRTVVEDKPKSVIFTEGWRDAVAATQAGYSAMASSGGASCWKDEWLPAFRDKIVHIIFDADKAGVKAADRAAYAISAVAKEVRIVTLPYKIENDHGKDLFDFLQTSGDLADLIENSPVYIAPKMEKEGFTVLEHEDIDYLVDEYLKQSQVTYKYNGHDGLTICVDGRYQKANDDEVQLYLRRFLTNVRIQKKRVLLPLTRKTKGFTKDMLQSVFSRPEVYLKPSQKAPCSLDGSLDPTTTIAANNCLVSIKEAVPVEHEINEKYYTLNYLSYDYIRDAYSELWTKFIIDITLGDLDLCMLLQQWCGYLLLPTLRYQKFLLCTGDGANGKGVFFDTIAAAIGKKNVSNVPLAKFTNTHTLFGTYNKLVNMSNENAENLEKNSESILKEYTAGDKVLWEQKYKPSFFAYPTAKLMFATNELPRIRDHTDGLWRRMILVPFLAKFRGNDIDINLTEKLQKPKELSGILNWMIEGAKMLQSQGKFTEPEMCGKALEKFRNESDSARLFALDNLEVDLTQSCQIPCTLLHKWYQDWCKDNGFKPKNNVHFGRSLNSVYRVQKTRPWISEQRVQVYTGTVPQEGSEIVSKHSEWMSEMGGMS